MIRSSLSLDHPLMSSGSLFLMAQMYPGSVITANKRVPNARIGRMNDD